VVERNHRELWDVISSGDFPVPLPLATQMTIFGQLGSIDLEDKRRAPEAVQQVVEKFSDELIEEDYVIYGGMLNQWLEECTEPTGRIARAVEAMAGLCAIRSIAEYAPILFVRGRGRIAAFDEEELSFIENRAEERGSSAWIAAYAGWLRSKGYPGMADRLFNFQGSARELRVA
jgi:hypothetical protein